MKNKKQETGFMKFSKRLLIATGIIFVFLMVFLNSYESTLNKQQRTVENESTALKNDIDGLNDQKTDLCLYSHLVDIAKSEGYTSQQSSVAANVVSVQSE